MPRSRAQPPGTDGAATPDHPPDRTTTTVNTAGVGAVGTDGGSVLTAPDRAAIEAAVDAMAPLTHDQVRELAEVMLTAREHRARQARHHRNGEHPNPGRT